MNRVKAVQQALDGRTKPVYLEIGVDHGRAFRHISASEKIAVDPEFKLSARTRKQADEKGNTHYFEMTSDAFFENEAGILNGGVDVALIDGLHTYGQVLRDVENTLRYLRDDGVMFLHDCNPAFASIARPAASYADFRAQNRWVTILSLSIPAWSGDVWKAVVHLRSTREDLRVAVLDCDTGVAVVRKGPPESRLPYSPDQVAAMTYKDLAADRTRLLNLKSSSALGELLDR